MPATPGPDQSRIAFLGGVHRSGTTLVARLLAKHPECSGFSGTGSPEDEGEHLQAVYPDCWEYGGVGRFGFAPEMHMTEASPLASPQSRDELWSQWCRWWDLEKRVLVEKSPPNMLKMRFLQSLFPEARFVLILRHPVAAVVATLKWRSRLVREAAPHQLVRHWVRCHELALEDARHIEHLHVLRYEDAVTEPDRALGALAAFLGLDAPIAGEDVRPGLNESYFDRWRELKENPLRRRYVERIERRYEPAIGRFGYSFDDPEPRFGPEALLALPT